MEYFSLILGIINLPYKDNFFNFIYLKNKKIIAIQVHLFYIDLLPEIINKTNNIPFLYDLFITIVSPVNKEYIEENLKNYSKANKFEVLTVENKGRDVLLMHIKGENNLESSNMRYHRPNIKYMNYILNNFGNFKIGEKLIFPNGNMFWAKIKSIHQMFEIVSKIKFPDEDNQINGTILHAIERIWIYIVKINKYYN